MKLINKLTSIHSDKELRRKTTDIYLKQIIIVIARVSRHKNKVTARSKPPQQPLILLNYLTMKPTVKSLAIYRYPQMLITLLLH